MEAGGLLVQRDTYFHAPRGRLKLREEDGAIPQLIAYDRPDFAGQRESRYRIVEVDNAEELKTTLSGSLGVRVVVEKERQLFVWEGNVRIHLDRVKGLGSFIEFEAVATAGSDFMRERAQISHLRDVFEIREEEVIGSSYGDLMRAMPANGGSAEAEGGNAHRERLEQQLGFILESDKLKSVLRQTSLIDGSRRENDAEHSWELALMAIVLAEHADGAVDLPRVVNMLLIHDIVEIDAGDTPLYDEEAAKSKVEREERAAERLFGLLPADQAEELRGLWNEFEGVKTAEARFARALDRLQPLLHNFHSGGGIWRQWGLDHATVEERNEIIGRGSPVLWAYAQDLLRRAVDEGFLLD